MELLFKFFACSPLPLPHLKIFKAGLYKLSEKFFFLFFFFGLPAQLKRTSVVGGGCRGPECKLAVILEELGLMCSNELSVVRRNCILNRAQVERQLISKGGRLGQISRGRGLAMAFVVNNIHQSPFWMSYPRPPPAPSGTKARIASGNFFLPTYLLLISLYSPFAWPSFPIPRLLYI